jgi:carboxypeptidase Q
MRAPAVVPVTRVSFQATQAQPRAAHSSRVRRAAGTALVALFTLAPALHAQERIDHDAIARIRDEGFNRSHVLETAIRISDVHGPRLAGSASYARAAEWTRATLAGWGADARLEAWGRRGVGWEIDGFAAEMTAPWYLNLNAIPKAWSTYTAEPVSGTPLVVSVATPGDFDQYRGRLRGRIVMNGAIQPIRDRFTVPAVRWTDAQLDSLANLAEPGAPRSYAEDADGWAELLETREQIEAFWRDEGVALVIDGSTNPIALRAVSHVSYTTEPRHRVPALILARSEFNTLLRMLERDVPVHLEVSIRTRFTMPDSLGYNIVADLPGTDARLRDQVVMMGGHFDSWHVGTGATDNAAGSAVAMEALRILRATGLPLRRTVRVALWDGEEQEEYHGSMGYVRRHFGDPVTGTLRTGPETLAAYFNIDNGTGRIRGIFAQGNEAAAAVFRELLAPFADLDAATVSIANVGSTDHIPFAGLGLPAFQFIQDRLDYFTRTHHTALDMGDYLVEEDLQQAAVVLAALVYHVANRDELLPRLPVPVEAR